MSKYVEDYWVEELPNGVIHLLINCTQREIYFHNFSDYSFLVCGTQEEYDNWDNSLILNTKEFLPKDTEVFIYISSYMKEKDQLNFYYIPYKKEWIKNRKLI